VETTPRWYFFYEKGEKRGVKGEERKRERKRNRRKRKETERWLLAEETQTSGGKDGYPARQR
jgi:hypothetical protein